MQLIKSIKKYIKRKLGIETLHNKISELNKHQAKLEKENRLLREELKTNRQSFQMELLKINNALSKYEDMLKASQTLFNKNMDSQRNQITKIINLQRNEIMKKIYSYMDESKYPIALSDWYFEKTGKNLT